MIERQVSISYTDAYANKMSMISMAEKICTKPGWILSLALPLIERITYHRTAWEILIDTPEFWVSRPRGRFLSWK